MTIAQMLIEKLLEVTGSEPLPLKFFADYSPDARIPTFKNVLNKYAEYYKNLTDPLAKKKLSDIFWKQIRAVGTPIIEERPDGQSEVYFLFPREKLSESVESKGYKKDLYLQGDFHGYGSTMVASQGLNRLGVTDIMFRSDQMPKDALVTYYYVQLERSHRNKMPLEFYGSVLEAQPKSFFPAPKTILGRYMEAQKKKQADNANELFWGKARACPHLKII